MRRRFENIKTVASAKISVFACSILAPTTTWRKPVPILGCRYRFNGMTMAASYVLDEVNNSKVCTIGGNPASCAISNSGQYIQAYFNEGQVTGNIILQFTIGDVFYYFFITEGHNQTQTPQLELSSSTYLIHSIHTIGTVGNFVPVDTYVDLQ